MESEEYYHTRWPGLSIFDEVTKNGAICNVRLFPLVKHILLDYLVKNLHADGRHSRPFRRQWTIPGTICISMLPSARQKARKWCQESRLPPRVSSRNLGTGDCIEIAPVHARSQSRLLIPHPSFLTRRGKHGDTHSARNRPLATKWSRMMTCRAWVQIISAAHNARLDDYPACAGATLLSRLQQSHHQHRREQKLQLDACLADACEKHVCKHCGAELWCRTSAELLHAWSWSKSARRF